jgi:hypothetical protein
MAIVTRSATKLSAKNDNFIEDTTASEERVLVLQNENADLRQRLLDINKIRWSERSGVEPWGVLTAASAQLARATTPPRHERFKRPVAVSASWRLQAPPRQ